MKETTNSLYMRALTVVATGFSDGVPFASNGTTYIPVGSERFPLDSQVPSNHSGVASVFQAQRRNEESSWQLALSRFSETATNILLVLWNRAPQEIISNEQAAVLLQSKVGGISFALVSLIPGGVVTGSDGQCLINEGASLIVNGVRKSLLQGASASC